MLCLSVTPARLASSKLSIWWNFVPFAPIYFFIRGFFPYKDEQRIKYNRAAATLIPLYAFILHIFLLIVFAVIYDFITLPTKLDYVNADSENAHMDIGLVKREITRMKEFGEISLNPSEADKLIKELSDVYGLDEISQEDSF